MLWLRKFDETVKSFLSFMKSLFGVNFQPLIVMGASWALPFAAASMYIVGSTQEAPKKHPWSTQEALSNLQMIFAFEYHAKIRRTILFSDTF